MSRLSVAALGVFLVAVAAASPYNYYVDSYNPEFYGTPYNNPEDFFGYAHNGQYYENPELSQEWYGPHFYHNGGYEAEGFYPVIYNSLDCNSDNYDHGRFNPSPYYGFRYYGY